MLCNDVVGGDMKKMIVVMLVGVLCVSVYV